MRALARDLIIRDTDNGAVAGFPARRRTGDALTHVLK